jgi:hypothetical protein
LFNVDQAIAGSKYCIGFIDFDLELNVNLAVHFAN